MISFKVTSTLNLSPLTTLCFFGPEDDPLLVDTGAILDVSAYKGVLLVLKVAKRTAEVASKAPAATVLVVTALDWCIREGKR